MEEETEEKKIHAHSAEKRRRREELDTAQGPYKPAKRAKQHGRIK